MLNLNGLLIKEKIVPILVIFLFLLLFYNWITPAQTLSNVKGERELVKGYSMIFYSDEHNITYNIKNLYIDVKNEYNLINLKLEITDDNGIDNIIFSVLYPNEIYDLKVTEIKPYNTSYSISSISGAIFTSSKQPNLFLFSESDLKIRFNSDKNESYIYIRGTTVNIEIENKSIKKVFVDLEFKTSSSFFNKDNLKESLPFHIPFWSYPIYPFFKYYISFGLLFPKANLIGLENLVLSYPGNIEPIVYSIPSTGENWVGSFGVVGLIQRNIIEPYKIVTANLTKWMSIESIVSNSNWPLSHNKGNIILGEITRYIYGPSKPQFEGPGILAIYEEFKPVFSLEIFIISLIFVILFSIAVPKILENKRIETFAVMITLFIFIFGIWGEEFSKGIHLNILDFGYAILLAYLFFKGISIMNPEKVPTIKRIFTPTIVVIITYYVIFSIFRSFYKFAIEYWTNIMFNVFLIYLPYATSFFFTPILGIITAILKFFFFDSFAMGTTSLWKYAYLFRYFGYVLIPYIYNKLKDSKYNVKIRSKLKYEFLHRILLTTILLWICWLIFHLIFIYVGKIKPEDVTDYLESIIELFIVVISVELNILVLKKLKINL
jgi:hypothetical protein